MVISDLTISTFFLIFGILVYKINIYIYILILTLNIFLFLFFYKNFSVKIPILFILFFIAGGLRYHQVNNRYITVIKNFSNNKSLSFIGYVDDIEYTSKETNKKYKTVILLKIQEPINTGSYIKLYCSDKINLKIGSIIELNNIVIKPNNIDQVAKDQIAGICFIYKFREKLVREPAFWDFGAKFKNLRNNLRTRIKNKLNIQSYSLFELIFLGKQENSTNNFILKNKFKYWGILHYLARSGLHVILILSLLKLVSRFIPINFFIKQFFITIIIIFYSLLTWPSISFNRAYNTFLAYQLFKILKIPVYINHIFGLIILATILHNPFCLFFLDFQLSFGLTLALLLFNYFKK